MKFFVAFFDNYKSYLVGFIFLFFITGSRVWCAGKPTKVKAIKKSNDTTERSPRSPKKINPKSSSDPNQSSPPSKKVEPAEPLGSLRKPSLPSVQKTIESNESVVKKDVASIDNQIKNKASAQTEVLARKQEELDVDALRRSRGIAVESRSDGLGKQKAVGVVTNNMATGGSVSESFTNPYSNSKDVDLSSLEVVGKGFLLQPRSNVETVKNSSTSPEGRKLAAANLVAKLLK